MERYSDQERLKTLELSRGFAESTGVLRTNVEFELSNTSAALLDAANMVRLAHRELARVWASSPQDLLDLSSKTYMARVLISLADELDLLRMSTKSSALQPIGRATLTKTKPSRNLREAIGTAMEVLTKDFVRCGPHGSENEVFIGLSGRAAGDFVLGVLAEAGMERSDEWLSDVTERHHLLIDDAAASKKKLGHLEFDENAYAPSASIISLMYEKFRRGEKSTFEDVKSMVSKQLIPIVEQYNESIRTK